MVGIEMIEKIRDMLTKKDAMEEADVRTLMILIRKLLDLIPQSDQQQFLIIRLFANWSVHTQITRSNTGLRILSAINDALVTFKSADTNALITAISNEIGFSALRKEMKLFFDLNGIDDSMVSDNHLWAVFVNHLIEIILDVPLSFPPISGLKKTERKIYDQIARNPIKPGAGVIAIKISNVDYNEFGAKGIGKIMCIVIRTEDTTTTFVPLSSNTKE